MRRVCGTVRRLKRTVIQRLRVLGTIEGISFLVLMGIAMPLKYLGGMPLAVRLVGSVHGALFVVLGLLVLRGLTSRGRPVHWGGKIMVASVLPFGTFMIDRRLRAEVDAEREGVPQRG